MTLEKVKELMQTRMDYFEQHLSDETITAQLKAYTANLGTVPDDIAEAAFYAALGNCRYPKQFLADWQEAVRDIQLDALPSPEQMWVNTLAAAKRIDSELECARNGGNLDEENSREKCLARAWDVFNALPEAVRKLYGNPSAMRSLLASRDTSVSEMNRIYRPAFIMGSWPELLRTFTICCRFLQNGLKKATKRITLTAATQETRSRFYGKLPRGMIRS